jgi:hypothetical protein
MPSGGVVLDIPHGGQLEPSAEVICELHKDITTGDLMREADLYSTEFYRDQPGIPAVKKIFLSQMRAIIDVNRALDDFSPDGIVKTHTSRGKQIYYSSKGIYEGRRDALIDDYAKPYMDRLQRAVESPGTRLVVLCHTMDPVGPAAGVAAGKKRPLITIANGGDNLGNPDPNKPYQLPRDIMDQIKDEIESSAGKLEIDNTVISNSQIVGINKPYRGKKSIDRIGAARLLGRKAFMIEVNKSLVMDAETLAVTNPGNVAKIREIIGAVIENVLRKI